MLFSSSLVVPFVISLSTLSVHAAPYRSTNEVRGIKRLEVRDEDGPCKTLFSNSDASTFLASDVWDCLASIPFDKKRATQLVTYLRDTLPFHSTLTYLDWPTDSYQQPWIDLDGTLRDIQTAIDDDQFDNEYEFEALLQYAFYGAHDSNLNLDAGILSAFSFGSEYSLASISRDGKELPKPYLRQDLDDSRGKGANWEPSPIVKIDDEDAIDWLNDFASTHSFGLLDPHADFNALMYNPAGDIQYLPTAITGQSPFYPGDTIKFTLANGTEINSEWRALVDVPSDAPSISNGKEVYDYFVLGKIPEEDMDASKTRKRSVDKRDEAEAEDDISYNNWREATGVTNYPDVPDIIQPNFGFGGYISGYFLKKESIAVLSIPSFAMTGSALSSFSTTVGKFIASSKKAGMKKVVIDLQQNFGGDDLLATDVFKQFFPPIEPYGGSHMRLTDAAVEIGSTLTNFWLENRKEIKKDDEQALMNSAWAILDFINADTGKTFEDYEEWYGPQEANDDFFSTTQRNNLANTLFTKVATAEEAADVESFDEAGVTDGGITIFGYGHRKTSAAPPYKAEDIIVLTDSICHDACAHLVEMMHHEAGVRTVVVGGRPNQGPMQAVAGSRGALQYTASKLDDAMYTSYRLSGDKTDLPDSHIGDAPDFWINRLTFNLRDSVRRDEVAPLQFAYEAADCRIYWTHETFANFAALWRYAADAVWGDHSKCVPGSVNYHKTAKTDFDGPSDAQKVMWGGYDVSLTEVLETPDGIPYTDPNKDSLVARQTKAAKTSKLKNTPTINYQYAAKPAIQPKATKPKASSTKPLTSNTLDKRTHTLNEACKQHSQCDGQERCVDVGSCPSSNSNRCKIPCKLSAPQVCPDSYFCHVKFPKCETSSNVESCNKQNSLESFKGSGSTKGTNGLKAPNLSGYCEKRTPLNVCWAEVVTGLKTGSGSGGGGVGSATEPDDEALVPEDTPPNKTAKKIAEAMQLERAQGV